MFAFQTMHSMNSLTGSLGVGYFKVLFMLLLFSTKQNSFIGLSPHLMLGYNHLLPGLTLTLLSVHTDDLL